MLIDTHCHLNFDHFTSDRDAVIKRAHAADVAAIINVGADIATSAQSVALAKEYDYIYAAVGVHPHYAENFNKNTIRDIEALADNKKVVAIGEIGLDYYDKHSSSMVVVDNIKVLQQKVLVEFLQLASKLKLPVIFHCRDAADDVWGVIKDEYKPFTGGVMHCFSQDKVFLKQCLDMGWYISFTANITYKKSIKLRGLIKYMPLDKLLIETDAPFLAWEGCRGKRNEPANLKFLVREIANIRKMDYEKVAIATSKNACQLFNINVLECQN